jgi:hypothetical protein
MSTSSKRKTLVICTLIAMLVGVLVAGAIMFSQASAAARRIQAYGRLAQMRLALQLFEEEHGALPPLYLRDNLGEPIQSWRALILPYLGGELPRLSKQMDLSQRWNSDSNDSLIAGVPPEDWVWFAWDRPQTRQAISTHIVAYLGRASIWDARTGLPRGKTTEHPDAVLLIWIAKGNVHPLQPGDITEEEVRERIGKGEELLFLAASSSSSTGIVTIERGEVVFRTWQQVLDRKKGRHL